MGKKAKTNRKKAPVATAAATVAATAAATETEVGEFPESTFLVKGESFFKKGNHAKAQKIFVQGLETGCVPCMHKHAMQILYDGTAIENRMNILVGKATIENRIDMEYFEDNKHLHLVLPLFLEGAVRGNPDAIKGVCGLYKYGAVRHETEDVSRYVHRRHPAIPLILYWRKLGLKNAPKYYASKNQRTQAKKMIEEIKEHSGDECSVCKKQDSETVTLMKCDGCKFYFYCSKECQQKMWQEGQHAGVCRHLGLLQKYHKPFAKNIWKDIAVHGIAPQDIPELQELRHHLGLSRPQEDYQDRLDARIDSVQLILPRKDGTVQIGSFPRPI